MTTTAAAITSIILDAIEEATEVVEDKAIFNIYDVEITLGIALYECGLDEDEAADRAERETREFIKAGIARGAYDYTLWPHCFADVEASEWARADAIAARDTNRACAAAWDAR